MKMMMRRMVVKLMVMVVILIIKMVMFSLIILSIRASGLWFPVDPGANASICGMCATGRSFND